jgi:hypothetical protein
VVKNTEKLMKALREAAAEAPSEARPDEGHQFEIETYIPGLFDPYDVGYADDAEGAFQAADTLVRATGGGRFRIRNLESGEIVADARSVATKH